MIFIPMWIQTNKKDNVETIEANVTIGAAAGVSRLLMGLRDGSARFIFLRDPMDLRDDLQEVYNII